MPSADIRLELEKTTARISQRIDTLQRRAHAAASSSSAWAIGSLLAACALALAIGTSRAIREVRRRRRRPERLA